MNPLKKMIKKIVRKTGLKSILPFGRKGNAGLYNSETSKCRSRLSPFCKGYGVDLGFGGDPINDTCIRIDMAIPYANTGLSKVQLGGDAQNLHWFRDCAGLCIFLTFIGGFRKHRGCIARVVEGDKTWRKSCTVLS